jgi:hypothetical protein
MERSKEHSLKVTMGTQSTTPSGGAPGPANAYQTLFDAAYYASKAPAFQQLYPPAGQALTYDQRAAIVAQLIASGYVVDEEIDFLGWDPYIVMYMREQAGDTWVPAGLGATTSAVAQPAQFIGPVPAGAIAVSTLLADYPPYPVPAANAAVTPPIPLAPNPVGMRIIPQVPEQPSYVGDIFKCAVANDGYPYGATWTGTSGAFTGTWTKEGLELNMLICWVKTQ